MLPCFVAASQIKQTPFARCCSRRNRAAAAATGRETDLLQSIGRSRVRARPAEGRRHAGAPQPRQRRGPYGHPAERWRCGFMFSFSFCTYFTDLVPIKFSAECFYYLFYRSHSIKRVYLSGLQTIQNCIYLTF